MPEQQSGKNSFAGMGATLMDGLSTLWLMGLKAEFYRGRDWVAKDLKFPKDVVGHHPCAQLCHANSSMCCDAWSQGGMDGAVEQLLHCVTGDQPV